jgi:PAT family beta-lactamase induction signal transducer AmpG
VWVSTTYFGEGFPYSIVNNLAEILFTELGASLGAIGLTSLFHLPWNLKFLWGPFLDHFETKRRWLIGVEVALTATLVALSFFSSTPQLLGAVVASFLILAMLSATHDTAIDGFYLEGLDDAGQSRFVGYRAMAYKVASLVVRGPLIILVGWVGWTGGLVASAVLMLALTALHWRILPRIESRKQPWQALVRALLRPRVLLGGAAVAAVVAAYRQHALFARLLAAGHAATQRVGWLQNITASGWVALGLFAALVVTLAFVGPIKRRLVGRNSYYAAAFVDFLARPQVGRVLAFVVLFRTGESFLQKMKWPFLRDQMGMGLEAYGFANGTLGVLASFTATFVGGWLIARHGLRRWIWPFVLAQNTLNLLYMGLAFAGQEMTVGLVPLSIVIMAEHFGEGLGTAVFMVYLMRSCNPSHKAAHMAILTALMSVSFTFAGVGSGFLAGWMGFPLYFGFTFLVTAPAMILVAFVPNLDR